MYKIAGFLVLVGIVAVALQPNLFFDAQNEPMQIEDFTSRSAGKAVEENEAQYAEGYSAEDFGAAFDHPADTDELFPIGDMQEPQGAWTELLKLDFDVRYDKDVDDVVFEPKYTKKLLAMEGKVIELEGFLIPYDIAAKTVSDLSDDGQRFMFSAYPIANCFFCGGAGAESVVEAFPAKPIPYSKHRITIKGKLKLNKTDYLKLPYILENVEMVYKDS